MAEEEQAQGPSGPTERDTQAPAQAQDPERIERRRRVVALIAALQKRDDDKAEALIAELSRDPDLRRVVGSLGVAGSSMVETLSAATKRPVDELLAELEEKMTQAPTVDDPPAPTVPPSPPPP